MTPLARALAVLLALTGVVAGLAALVRAVTLAANERRLWPLPSWWHGLGHDGSFSWPAAAAGTALAVLAIVCLVLAVRELSPPRPPSTAEVSGAQVKLGALERLVATRLRSELAGVVPTGVRVSWAGPGWHVRVEADVPPRDLVGVRQQARELATAELVRATGARLSGLDLEVRRFTAGGR